MNQETFLTTLRSLPPESRERIEAALSKTLTTELSKDVAAAGAEPAQFSRSKGPVFSKSKTGDNLRESLQLPGDAELLKDITKMADDDFGKFADRLATLRKMKGV